MTADQFVELVLDEEGRVYEEPPHIDQPTGPGGVTLQELSDFRGQRQTVDALKTLTIAEAKPIIEKRFHDPDFASIHDESLRVQLLDFAYNSGKATAVRWLQRTANAFLAQDSVDVVNRRGGVLNVDGKVGPRTLAIINRLPPVPLNNALAAERAHMAYHGAMDHKFAAGVAHRAIEFVDVLA